MFCYRLFGLSIKSSIYLPEAYEIQDTHSLYDVEIESNTLHQSSLDLFTSTNFRFDNGQFQFHVPDTAVYCITSGTHIRISSYPGADEAKVRLYLLGTCMGVLLMQRGILPLHGSAAVIAGKVYAIVGESGAGKSTLAAAFAHTGYPLMTDDVIAVSLAIHSEAESALLHSESYRSAAYAREAPMVHPSYPQQKLWKESIVQLGLHAQNYSTLHQKVNKYAVPMSSRFHEEPLPLAGIIELNKVAEPEPSMKAYSLLEGLHVLNVHTYRQSLLQTMGLKQWHFGSIAQLASRLPIYQLRRPIGSFTAFDLVDRIVGQIHKEEAAMHERRYDYSS